MDETSSTVLRSDQKRVRQSAASRWRKLLDDQRVSGLPVSAFCRERGIAASSLFAWRRKLADAGRDAFKPVTVVARRAPVARREPRRHGDGGSESDGAPIELCLPAGRRVLVRRGFDRRLLAEVISALESPGSPS